MIQNGYRRIGAILGHKTITTGRDRLEGYRLALRDAGIPHDPRLERHGDFNEQSGRQCARELLELDPPIDALFVGSNFTTVGALDVLHERGLRVPDDIAVIGYDEMPWSALGTISLTTVTQPTYELGSAAAERLFQRLQNPAAQARQEIILAQTLCIRGSSAPRNSFTPSSAATTS